MYELNEQKNQHTRSFTKKKYKYNKFLEDVNQDTLNFLKNKSKCNKVHKEKISMQQVSRRKISRYIKFYEQKSSRNRFHEQN